MMNKKTAAFTKQPFFIETEALLLKVGEWWWQLIKNCRKSPR